MDKLEVRETRLQGTVYLPGDDEKFPAQVFQGDRTMVLLKPKEDSDRTDLIELHVWMISTWSKKEELLNEIDRLRAALRALAKPLVEAAGGSLEGPDIEEILEKADLIAWHTFDRGNPEHESLAEDFDFEIDDGDRFWRLTDFGKEVLGHE